MTIDSGIFWLSYLAAWVVGTSYAAISVRRWLMRVGRDDVYLWLSGGAALAAEWLRRRADALYALARRAESLEADLAEQAWRV